MKVLFIVMILGWGAWQARALAQDELYIKKMLLQERLQESNKEIKKMVYDLQVSTPIYKVDLNQDKYKEGIIYHKDNGRDVLHILSHQGELIKSFELDAFGKNAVLDRISIKQLSAETNVMILYFYAGEQEYIDYKGQGRLYFINIDKGSFAKMSIQKGPSFWSEAKDSYGNYHRRHYKVDLKDLNHDGVKEILVKYASISQVCMYQGEGKWVCK